MKLTEQQQYARQQAWETMQKYGDSQTVMLAILESLILSAIQHDPRYKGYEKELGLKS